MTDYERFTLAWQRVYLDFGFLLLRCMNAPLGLAALALERVADRLPH